MKTNINRSIGRIIYLADMRYFESKNSNGKISSLYGRMAVPQPVPVEVDGKRVYKDSILDFQIVGAPAEFVNEYLRGHYAAGTEGKKDNGFIAREVSVTGYLEQYTGKVYNDEPVEVELDNGDTVTFDAGQLPIMTTKTRMRIIGLDALDFIAKEDNKPAAEPSGNTVKGKVKSNAKPVAPAAPANTSAKPASAPAKSKAADDAVYEEVMEIPEDEMPF